MSRRFDVIVIGAGPYGLSAAAELRQAGANVHVLGSPMSFWMRHMPRGMFLRSPWSASHLGDPRSALSLAAFERARGARLARPIPLSDFIAYGGWFQRQAALDVDPRQVERVEKIDAGFNVLVEDGEALGCRRVVVAAGIAAFSRRPVVFDGLHSDLASHSSEHDDLTRFAGRRVAVIGGGQSAIESAALLQEGGADVHVIMRARHLQWVGRAPREGFLGRVLFDRTDVGPLLLSHLIARPRLLRVLPPRVRHDSTRRALAPGASLWLRPRIDGLTLTTGRQVTAAERSNGRLRLQLDDGSTRSVDHVILATGYRVDVRRYRFLGSALLERLRCASGHPLLDEGLESSVPGLHFIGAPATHSFGPLLRFVAGTEFAARRLVRSATGKRAGAVDVAPDRAADVQQAAQRAP